MGVKISPPIRIQVYGEFHHFDNLGELDDSTKIVEHDDEDSTKIDENEMEDSTKIDDENRIELEIQVSNDLMNVVLREVVSTSKKLDESRKEYSISGFFAFAIVYLTFSFMCCVAASDSV